MTFFNQLFLLLKIITFVYCSHHVFFGGSASPMFDSLSMLTNSNSTSRHHGLRQALRFRKRRPRRGGGAPPSPTLLPPFKSSDTLCTATGADLGMYVFNCSILSRPTKDFRAKKTRKASKISNIVTKLFLFQGALVPHSAHKIPGIRIFVLMQPFKFHLQNLSNPFSKSTNNSTQ